MSAKAASMLKIGLVLSCPPAGADQLRDKVYSPTWEQLGFLFSLLYEGVAL
jgi:hypothetical protein